MNRCLQTTRRLCSVFHIYTVSWVWLYETVTFLLYIHNAKCNHTVEYGRASLDTDVFDIIYIYIYLENRSGILNARMRHA